MTGTDTTAGVRAYLSFPRLPGQVAALDGLRAAAVLLVLLRHAAHVGFSDSVPLPAVLEPFAVFMRNGWVGVDLFFVLSGYLITHHILRQRARGPDAWSWRSYLSRRALRIVPAYFAVLLLAIVGAFPGFEVAREQLGFRVLYHALFLQDLLVSNVVVVFWSLGVEEKFYLIAPVLVTAAAAGSGRWRRFRLPLILLCAGVALRLALMLLLPEVTSYGPFFRVFRSPFPVCLDGILVGVAIALVAREPALFPRLTSPAGARTVFGAGVVALAALLFGSDLLATITVWDKTLQPLAIALGFGAITWGALFGAPTRWLEGSTLRVTARLSYCLYLVHLPLVPLASRWVGVAPGEATAFVPFMAAYFAVSFGAALALHYAVEKPFLAWKERVGSPGQGPTR